MSSRKPVPSLSRDAWRRVRDEARAAQVTGFRRELLTVPLSFACAAIAIAWGTQSPTACVMAMPVLGAVMMFHMICIHECGHRSLYRTRWINDAVGPAAGFFICMPFDSFRSGHQAHHLYAGGTIDRDPTPARELPESRWLSLMLAVRIVPFLFVVGVHRPYFRHAVAPRGDRANRRSVTVWAVNLAAIMAGHVVLARATHVGWYALLMYGGFAICGVLYEHLFTQNHHVGLRPETPRETFKCREQAAFSRSVRMPGSGWLFHFNLHKEHHLFPQENHRRLPLIHRILHRDHPELMQFTSDDIAPLTRRRHARLFRLQLGDPVGDCVEPEEVGLV